MQNGIGKWRAWATALVCVVGGCDDAGAPGAAEGGVLDGGADAAEADARAGDLGVGDASPDAAGDAFIEFDSGSDGSAVDAAIDAGPIEPPLPACDPPLTLAPDTAVVAAFGLQVFMAGGGTGAWQFSLASQDTDAEVHPETGAYLAGGVVGVTDTVVLSDRACAGEARADVEVVPPLRLRPSEVTLAPGDGFTFEVEGGAGPVDYRWISDRSGGALEDGRYTAGPTLGLDVIEAVDPATGLAARARMRVVANPRLTTDPPRLYMASGSETPFEITGGSGEFVVDVEGGAVEIDEDTLILFAAEPGRAELQIRDRFVDQRTTLGVDVVASLTPPLRRVGRNTRTSVARGLGDVNGDGFADAALALSEASIDQASDGAVYIYHGGPEGLQAQPAQVLFGTVRGGEFGRALEIADVDADGQVDLIVGTWMAPADGTRRGRVEVFRGQPDGRFETSAAWTAAGARDDDRLGTALSVCDFDGDGRLDLAVNAYQAEAPEVGADGQNQGAIFIYRGVADGFADEPDAMPVFGQVWRDDAWLDQANLRLGATLASGDFDGDDVCDLAAWVPGFSSGEGRSNDGAVHLYRGGEAGLASTPARVWVGDEETVTQGAFGRRMTLADVNADGFDDLVAGHAGFDDPGFGANIGVVRIFAGGPLDGPWMGTVSAGSADWQHLGDFPGDQFATDVSVGDFDGDAHPDLLVGSLTQVAEPVFGVPGPFEGGTARIYRGQADDWPDRIIAHESTGAIEREGFGSAAAIVGDSDGDGHGDLLVMAARADNLGPDVGQPYFVNGATGERRPLDMPGAATGAWFGWSMAIIDDVTGDARPDLLVGAPEHAAPDAARSGSAFVFAGTPDGYAAEASLILDQHEQHSANDLYGYGVASGDFDGDGRPDIAVAARGEDALAPVPIGAVSDGNCLDAGSDIGAVFIHRGRAGGVNAVPSWAVFGLANRALMDNPIFADLNGDGLDDLILGGWQWRNAAQAEGSNQGGVAVYFGRPADPAGGLRLVCNPALVWQGEVSNGRAGRALVPMGDLDADGCDEIAFGAPSEATEGINGAGVVRILYGWGAGCAARPRMAAFSGRQSAAEFGFALAVGDVVGDARPDLLIGAPNQIEPLTNQRRGAFSIIDGFWLAGLRPVEIADRPPFIVHAQPGNEVRVIHGRHAGSRFGHGVAATHGIAIVSHLYSPVGRAARVGGGSMYQVGADGPALMAGFVAESWRPESRVGESLTADPHRPLVLFGGALGAGFQPDAGAVYPIDLSGMP